MLYLFCLVYIRVFFKHRFNIHRQFVYVVSDKSNVICMCRSIISSFRIFCHILCSNCGHEGVQWILETYHVQYNNNAHVYE